MSNADVVFVWNMLTEAEARAAEAERERDEWRHLYEMRERELTQIVTRKNPMITVDENGRLCKLVFANAWDRAPSDPDRVTVYYEDEPMPPDAPPMYTLSPIEEDI